MRNIEINITKCLQWFNSTGEFMDEKFCLLFVQNSYNEIRILSLFKKKMELPKRRTIPLHNYDSPPPKSSVLSFILLR